MKYYIPSSWRTNIFDTKAIFDAALVDANTVMNINMYVGHHLFTYDSEQRIDRVGGSLPFGNPSFLRGFVAGLRVLNITVL